VTREIPAEAKQEGDARRELVRPFRRAPNLPDSGPRRRPPAGNITLGGQPGFRDNQEFCAGDESQN